MRHEDEKIEMSPRDVRPGGRGLTNPAQFLAIVMAVSGLAAAAFVLIAIAARAQAGV